MKELLLSSSERIEFLEIKIQQQIDCAKGNFQVLDGRKACTFLLTDDSNHVINISLIYENGNISFSNKTLETTDCTMTLSYVDFIDLFKKPYHSYYLAWQGKINVKGDKSVMVWFDDVIFNQSGYSGNTQAGQYSALARLFPDPKFQFMNLGFANEKMDTPSTDIWFYSKELLEETIWRKDLDNSSILDVGSGRGGNVKYLSSKFINSHVTGLDSCTEAIEFCKKNIIGSHIEFTAGDACNLPYKEASFDYIINLESAHCYKDIDHFIRGAYKILKPGGTLFLTDIIKSNKVERMSALFEMVGFHIEKKKNLSDGVVRAIIKNREKFKSFLENKKNKKNDWILDNLINSVNNHFQESLTNKDTIYYSWLLQKP